METTKKSLLIFLGVIIVGGSAYVGFNFSKKYLTKQSDQIPAVATSTESVISGFKRDQHGAIPKAIPEGLITEKAISVIESFTQDLNDTHQATFKYATKRDRNENFFAFNKFLYSKGWTRGMGTQVGDSRSVQYNRLNDTLYISYSSLEDIGEIVDITIVTKDK